MTKQKTSFSQKEQPMIFSKRNYQISGAGIALVVIGFFLMYMENEVNGVISLYLSPILIVAGYATVIYGIMAKPKTSEDA